MHSEILELDAPLSVRPYISKKKHEKTILSNRTFSIRIFSLLRKISPTPENLEFSKIILCTESKVIDIAKSEFGRLYKAVKFLKMTGPLEWCLKSIKGDEFCTVEIKPSLHINHKINNKLKNQSPPHNSRPLGRNQCPRNKKPIPTKNTSLNSQPIQPHLLKNKSPIRNKIQSPQSNIHNISI